MVSTTGLSLKALLNRSLLATHRTSLVVPGTTGKLWLAVEGVVMSSSSPRHSITLKRRLRPFLESLNMPNSVRKTAKRRAHVRGLRARSCPPLRRFQTATGVPLTAPTASCDVPELPSPEPCLAYAWSRPAENRLTHTYRPTAATSRRPRWPPTPSRRPLQPGRSTGYRRAGRPSLRSRFPSCRSRLSEAAPKITSERHMRSTPLCSGQIVQLRDHHAERVGNGDGLKGRTRSSPAKFVLMPHPHRISPQPAIAATRPRRP